MRVAKLAIDKYIEMLENLGIEVKPLNKTGYEGYKIIIPKNTKINVPISLVYVSTGENQKVLNKVIVKEGAFAKIYTYCTSLNEGYHLGKTIAIVKGHLESAKIHKIDSKSTIVSLNRYYVKKGILNNYLISNDSSGNSININKFYGIQSNIGEYVIYKQKEGLLKTDSKAYIKDSVAILKSRVVTYDGKVINKTLISGTGKGYSSCDGIILGKGKIYTMPALNTVKEGEYYHEASVGKINEQALLYLMSKGIDEETAKNIYIRGFLFRDLPEDEQLKFLIYSIFQNSSSK